ncbi:hypothetical protein T07_4297 [Trichinella nelsoni]|uniref:Uncharacterized protein n=1 Tax=Trichinella nelsoni TaxID=6336 RepID=A0A0V0S6I8_9BILA|nr:hypothetical protein T07_4297 [Trichinella nelsoni]
MIPNACYLNLNSQLNNDALVICKISTICGPQRLTLFANARKLKKFTIDVKLLGSCMISFTFFISQGIRNQVPGCHIIVSNNHKIILQFAMVCEIFGIMSTVHTGGFLQCLQQIPCMSSVNPGQLHIVLIMQISIASFLISETEFP